MSTDVKKFTELLSGLSHDDKIALRDFLISLQDSEGNSKLHSFDRQEDH